MTNSVGAVWIIIPIVTFVVPGINGTETNVKFFLCVYFGFQGVLITFQQKKVSEKRVLTPPRIGHVRSFFFGP